MRSDIVGDKITWPTLETRKRQRQTRGGVKPQLTQASMSDAHTDKFKTVKGNHHETFTHKGNVYRAEQIIWHKATR